MLAKAQPVRARTNLDKYEDSQQHAPIDHRKQSSNVAPGPQAAYHTIVGAGGSSSVTTIQSMEGIYNQGTQNSIGVIETHS